MSQRTIVFEDCTEHFDGETGEITNETKRAIKKSYIKPSDEYIKVSKYLNVLFAYNNIPLRLVPISLLFAQRMEIKTNHLTLLKDDKAEIAAMLDISQKRVEALIIDCKKYDIIRSITRGKYEVNGYLFSTGSIAETRELQAEIDFMSGQVKVTAEQKNRITGEVFAKAVSTYKSASRGKKEIPGQMTLPGLPGLETDKEGANE